MKLLLETLSGTPSHEVFEAPASWWLERQREAFDPESELCEPFRFSLAAHEMGEDVLLEGEVRGELQVPCSRCLARYRHALRESFRLVLEPVGDRLPLDPESAKALERDGLCLGAELETGWYRGAVLQLDAFFAELISLALPVQPLCREDCEGLCPQCGALRGREACDCVEQKPSSPFAVLETLRSGGSGGNL